MEILNGTAFDLEDFAKRMKQLVGRETYSSFGRRVGVSDAVVRKYCLGETMPSIGLVSQICGHEPRLFLWLCLGLGEQPEQATEHPEVPVYARAAQGDDTTGLAESSAAYHQMQDYTLVDCYQVFASAGFGATVSDELKTEPMAFRTDWLKKEGLAPERLAVIRAKGDSMEPTISNNDIILVNLCNGDALRDGLYVLRIGDSLLVKRLQFDVLGGIKVISDNPGYETQVVTKDQRADVHIVGRVAWAGKKF
ncbi:helix-turn-helix transcriptional regulator [Aeromonas media]|jgi:phage repressor protein C with HTH and peptisase S24 domain|uniref:S24 family peptidase n=2 Tax=Aeromonas TaxID=642 RepID=UPI0022815529|nr:LexA family transcriptional regulator [Aeromonas media]MCY9836441.1 transcriptional regulator [Aeromonas media]